MPTTSSSNIKTTKHSVLLPHTLFSVGKSDSPHPTIYAIRLTEEIVNTLFNGHGETTTLRITAPNEADCTLLVNETAFQLTLSHESQPVDLAKADLSKRHLTIAGRVEGRILVKQELAAQKASAIRQQSEQAQKERLARKTLTIDPVHSSKKGNHAGNFIIFVGIQRRFAASSSAIGGKTLTLKPTAALATTNTTKQQYHQLAHAASLPNDQIDRASSQSWSPPVQPAMGKQRPLADAEEHLQKISSAGALMKSSSKKAESVDRPQKLSSAAAAVKFKKSEATTVSKDVSDAYERLAQEYRTRYPAYAALESWLDRRLAIFEQLSKDLALAEGKAPARERISHRIRQEYESLQRDLEYRCKLGESEQMRSQLIRLTEQIEQQQQQQRQYAEDS